MPRTKTKIVTSIPMSLRDTPARKSRTSSEEGEKEKSVALKDRLFPCTNYSEGVRSLLKGKKSFSTPTTSGGEEDEEEVEEIVIPASGDKEYTSDSSGLNDKTSETQSELYARNPCPDWTVGSVALANFKLPGLPNRILIEKLISQEGVKELEASIDAAWNYEAEEISKEEEGT